MTQQQQEGICTAPAHVFIVADEARADEVRNILKLHGYELSPPASEPEDSDAVQQISAALPDTTVVSVQAAKRPDDSALSASRPNAPRHRDAIGRRARPVGKPSQS